MSENDLKSLIEEALLDLDPQTNISPGSPAQTKVVSRILAYVGEDPFDTDISRFLKTRLAQEFTQLSEENAAAISDLLISPFRTLMEPITREISVIKQRQSLKNLGIHTEETLDATLSNIFMEREQGDYSRGTVRLYFGSPQYVAATSDVRFYDGEGHNFYPNGDQFISQRQMLFNKTGDEYYFDAICVAQNPGEAYNVAVGAIKYVEGITGVKRVTNRFKFQSGLDRETNELYLTRAQNYPTEAALNARRGILYVIQNNFPAVDQIEVVGYGDSAMLRDKLTGGGYGPIVASDYAGSSIPVEDGDYDDYTDLIQDTSIDFVSILGVEGEISNRASVTLFWQDEKLVNHVSEHEIVEVVNSSTIRIADKLNLRTVNALTVRFHSLSLSDIPGGFMYPGQTEVKDGVHIGGAIDVCMKDTTPSEESSDLAIVSDETYVVITDQAEITSGSRAVVLKDVDDIREVVHENTAGGAYAFGTDTIQLADIKPGATYYVIPQRLAVGDVICFPTLARYYRIIGIDTSAYTSGLKLKLDAIPGSWSDKPYAIYKYHGTISKGMVLYLSSGEPGSYSIFNATGWVSTLHTYAGLRLNVAYEFTTTAVGVGARVYDNVEINISEPKTIKISDTDLSSIVGSSTVRSLTGHDFLALGVVKDDVLRILAGPNEGDYTVSAVTGPGNTHIQLTETMPFSVASQSYQVFTLGDAVDTPLLKVDSVELLNADLQPEGIDIPIGAPLAAITSDFSNMSRGSRYDIPLAISGAWGTHEETESVTPFPLNNKVLRLRFTFPVSSISGLGTYDPIVYTTEFLFSTDYTTAQAVADKINLTVSSLGAEFAFAIRGHVVLRPIGNTRIEILATTWGPSYDAAPIIGWTPNYTTTDSIVVPEDPALYGVNETSDYCYIESGPNGGQLFKIASIDSTYKIVYAQNGYLKPTDEDHVVLGFLSTGNVRFYFKDPTYFEVNQSTSLLVEDSGVEKEYIPDPTLATKVYPPDETKALITYPFDSASQISVSGMDAYAELVEDYWDSSVSGLVVRGDIVKITYRRLWFNKDLTSGVTWTSPAFARISVGGSTYRDIDLDDLPSPADIDDLIALINDEFPDLATKMTLTPAGIFLALDSTEEVIVAPNTNFTTAVGTMVPSSGINRSINFGEHSIDTVLDEDTLYLDSVLLNETASVGATSSDPMVQMEIYRYGTQRIDTTTMNTQVENNYYYADMEFVSKGVGDGFNIAPDLEGTLTGYNCLGYTLRNSNPALAFSTEEEIFARVTSRILELDVDCSPANMRLIAGKNIRITYLRSPTTEDVHTFITADTERVVCASVVAKHLLPVYLTGTISYTGQVDETTALVDVTSMVEGLSPDDRLEISDVSAALTNHGATYIQTPLVLAAFYQDVDRNMYVRFIEDTRELDDLSTFFVDEISLVRLS